MAIFSKDQDADAPRAESDLRRRLREYDEASLPDKRQPSGYVELVKLAVAAGERDVACEALLNLSHRQAQQGDFVGAQASLTRAMRLAHRHGLHAELIKGRLAQALLWYFQERHKDAFNAAVEVLKSPLAKEHLPPKQRSFAYVMLAQVCAMTSADECEGICIDYAVRVFTSAKLPVPAQFQACQAIHLLQLYFRSAPELSSALHTVKASADERAQWLQRLGQVLAPEALEGNSPAPVAVLEGLVLHRAIYEALKTGSASGLSAAFERWERLNRGHQVMVDEIRYRVAAACILLNQAELARRMLATGTADVQASPSLAVDTMNLLHLRAVVAERLGHLRDAAELYAQYSKLWASHAPRLPFDVLRVVKAIGDLPPPADVPAAEQGPFYLRKAIRLAQASPLKPPTVSQLAQAVQVSERALRDAFSQHLGKSPKQFLLELRLDAALAMQHQEVGRSMPLTELAHRAGFSNPSRFSAAYRKRLAEVSALPGV